MVVERWTYVRILSCKEGWTVVTKCQGLDRGQTYPRVPIFCFFAILIVGIVK